jgi:hypothetical protein
VSEQVQQGGGGRHLAALAVDGQCQRFHNVSPQT